MTVISTNQTTTFLFTGSGQTLLLMPGISLVTTGASAIATGTGMGFEAVDIYGAAVSNFPTLSLDGPGNNVNVGVGGLLASAGSSALIAFAGHTTLSNGGTVSATSPSSGAILMDGGSNSIFNSGRIVGGDIAINWGGSANQLANTGTIEATTAIAGQGTVNCTTLSYERIVNSGVIRQNGTITGTAAVWLESGGLLDLVNSGLIDSGSYGIAVASGSSLDVVNQGTIAAPNAIVGGNFSDRILNSGLIRGDIRLGDGFDIFENAGGTVTGAVIDGGGSDVYRLDRDMTIIDTVGNDYIEASCDFSLGGHADIENLVLIGSAQIGTGNAIANAITGNEQSNRLSGLDGNDSLYGNGGDDLADTGTGNDQANGGEGNDTLLGAAGADTLNGDAGDDSLKGGSGADTLNGGDGDDTLWGDTSNDRLSGDAGEDVLVGGAGRDTLFGGTDADTFVFRNISDSGAGAAVRDIISGFETGLDLIDLSRIDANATLAGNQAFIFIGTVVFTGAGAAGQLRVVNGANSVIQGDVNGDGVADFEIQLNGIAAINGNDILL